MRPVVLSPNCHCSISGSSSSSCCCCSVLDIGQSDDDTALLFMGDITTLMSMLMSSLPSLTHLDISGTNLAGFFKDPPVSHRLTVFSSADWYLHLLHLSLVHCKLSVLIIIIDNRGLNAHWCLTPWLLSLPTAAYLGQRGLTPAGLPHTTAQCHLTILG